MGGGSGLGWGVHEGGSDKTATEQATREQQGRKIGNRLVTIRGKPRRPKLVAKLRGKFADRVNRKINEAPRPVLPAVIAMPNHD